MGFLCLPDAWAPAAAASELPAACPFETHTSPLASTPQALALDGEMRSLAAKLQHESSLLVFGRGYNYATALEAALKVGAMR